MSKFTLIIFLILVFSSKSFAQAPLPEYTVRVVYFLPSDRTPQPDINAKLDRLIKNTQAFFAEQMIAHGFGQKTFAFEADITGNVVVHRVNGQFNEDYYNSGVWDKVWEEIDARFDLSNNIWLIALETSTEVVDNAWCGLGGGSSLQGFALIPASGGCFNVSVTGHELGHAFGLMHDNRISGRWIPSIYSTDRMITSFCSAEWLDVHRYFKRNQTLSSAPRPTLEMLAPNLSAPVSATPSQEIGHLCGVGAVDVQHAFKVNETDQGDAWPTFEMLGPPSLVAAPNTIRLRFRVTDPDGLHQVRLHTPEWNPYVAGEFIACQHLNGTSATVEFITTELSSRSEAVILWVIDAHGNFSLSDWYPIDIASVLPPATAVTIRDTNLAAAVRQKIGSITTRSLLNLRTLDTRDYTGIADLTGLEHAYNLKYLSVGLGGITDLQPLANLKGLTNLVLEKHQVSDLSTLRNSTNLTRLVLSENQISDISALRNLTHLDSLWLSGNQISDISAVANLTNLTWLTLDGNQISDISALQNLTHLDSLWLASNQISDISALTDLTNLKILGLNHNQITDVGPLVGLVNLEELYLQGNPIADLSPLRTLLANNPNLKIDIEVPQPPSGITFNPSTVADETLRINTPIVPLALPEATGGTAPYTYRLTPLPNGLSFDAAARLLSGTPTTPGTTNLTYTATDAVSATASLTFKIAVDADGDGTVAYMYWADTRTDKIQRAHLNGTNVQDLVTTGLSHPAGIDVDLSRGKVYWTDEQTHKIQRAHLNGTNVEDVITGVTSGAIDIDVATSKIYWAENRSNKIQCANLDGTHIKDIVTDLTGAWSLALDVSGGKIYWSDEATDKIQRANLDGTHIEDVVTGLVGLDGITVDGSGGKLYWADWEARKIQRANLDGTDIEDVVIGVNRPSGLALDAGAGKIYWTNWPSSKIQRANLDGTDIEDLVTGIGHPWGIALGIPSDPGTPNTAPVFTEGDATSRSIAENTPIGSDIGAPVAATDADNDVLTYTLGGTDAAAFSINTTTGQLRTATPLDADIKAVYAVTLTVSDGSLTDTIRVTINVTSTGGDNLDVNADGQLNVLDLILVAVFYGTRGDGLPADVNADGVVNVDDFAAVAAGVDAAGALPLQAVEAALFAAAAQAGDIEAIAGAPAAFETPQHAWFNNVAYYNVAAAFADVKHFAETGDLRLGKGVALLAELLQLLKEINAIPETTALLPNYPNPFNPETWIPYHLATEAEVMLTIYDTRGVAVRALMLGHQAAGVYQSKHRAAYWDGKNALGESVASGLYFYTLTVGEFTATRRLLIAK